MSVVIQTSTMGAAASEGTARRWQVIRALGSSGPRDSENRPRSGTDSGGNSGGNSGGDSGGDSDGDSGASTAFLDHDVKNNVGKVGKNTIARRVKWC